MRPCSSVVAVTGAGMAADCPSLRRPSHEQWSAQFLHLELVVEHLYRCQGSRISKSGRRLACVRGPKIPMLQNCPHLDIGNGINSPPAAKTYHPWQGGLT